MINKYRKKFTLVTMLSLFVLLGLMITLINVINYTKTCRDSDFTIKNIINNEGPFNNPFENENPPQEGFNPGGRDIEARFRTRYFIVSFNNDGTVTNTSAEKIALSDNEAVDLATTIYNKNTEKGFYEQYRFNVIDKEDGKDIVMLDCTMEREANKNFLFTSLIISLAGYLVVFGVILVVSKIVVRPFYENMEKQKRFITDASHELKTPLTIMNANVEVLEIENGENEWLSSIKNQISRLTDMTKKLTLMAKMDESSNVYEFKDFDISKVLQDTIDDFSSLSSTKDKKITANIEDEIIFNGNNELVSELFHILLENAYKYSEEDINILLKKDNKNILIEFSNKANVPNGSLDYLFDRFYRMDNSRNSSTGGNGIGLSIAKSIVDINRGSISAFGHNNIITFRIVFK